MVFFIFHSLVLCEYTDKFGVEYNNNKFTVLTSTSFLQTPDYTVPSGCEIINGGTTASDSSFRGCINTLKTLQFEEGSLLKCIYPFVFSNNNFVTLDLSNCEHLEFINTSICQGCRSLKTVLLPPKITEIKYQAFYNCKALTSISIPDSVTLIRLEAFRFCSNLASFEISENSSLTKIEGDCLGSTAITTIYLPKNFNSLGGAALLDTKLSNIEIHPSNSNFIFKNYSLIQDGTILVFVLPTKTGTYVVPSTITTISASAIRQTQFSNVTFEDSITSMDNWAFGSNELFTVFAFPEGLDYVPASCFCDCHKLHTVYLPQSIKEIKSKVFYNCWALENIYLHEGIEVIETQAFYSCSSLQHLNFPQSLKTLKTEVFTNCNNLQITSNNENFKFEDQMLFTNHSTQLNEYFGSNSTITIPSYCTKIGNSVFVGKLIDTVIILGEITEIMSSCFQGTPISSINFPSTLETLGSNVFESCNKLTTINLSDTQITEIPYRAFYKCINLETFIPPQNLDTISNEAFSNCTRLNYFNFSSTKISNISDSAFQYTDLSSNPIEFPFTLENLSNYAFQYCSLTSITFEPDSPLSNIPYKCFSHCENLSSLTFSKNIQIINEEAFSYCYDLGRFTIPNGIISIEPKAFYSCKSLSEVEFPLNCQLETIKGLAFGNCPLLKEFNINKNDNKFQFDNGVLTDKNGSSIYVYLPTSNNDYFVVPSRVTTIKPFAFQYCTNLESIYIPDGTLTRINNNAFEGCERLTTIYFPDSLKEVGSMAFHNCPKLRCGRVRVANDDIKAMVLDAGVSKDVFNTYCPSYEITCKNNPMTFGKTAISLIIFTMSRH